MMIRLSVLSAFAALLLALTGLGIGPVHSIDDEFDPDDPFEETVEAFALPAPPPLPNIEVEAAPVVSTAASLDGTMAPPPPAACITEAEYNAAMMGSGCDCSCNGYSALPSQPPAEQRRCMAVCGMPYYRCWAPPPTEGDIAGAVAEMGPGGSAILAQPEGRGFVIASIMMQRASDWHDAQMCPR